MRPFDPKRQRAAEVDWLKKHRPYDKIQGVDPYDPKSVGLIPINPRVYAPAGGVRKIREGLLEEV